MMKLGKRLNQIAKLIEKNNVVADIGCDHGKIMLHVLQHSLANFVYASDISEKSVNKTTVLLNKNNFKNFTTLTSDGFTAYNDRQLNEIDCFVIAGMGGQEIIKILKTVVNSKSFMNLNSFIIQPQNNVISVREFLNDNKVFVETDIMVEEKGKFYNVIKINLLKTFKKLTKNEILFGKTNLKNATTDFMKYLIYEHSKIKEIVNSTTGKTQKEFKEHLKKLITIQNKMKMLNKK